MTAQPLLSINISGRSVCQGRNSVLTTLAKSRITGATSPKAARDRVGCTPLVLKAYGTANLVRKMAVAAQATKLEEVTSKRVCL